MKQKTSLPRPPEFGGQYGEKESSQLSEVLEKFSLKATHATGTSTAFYLALSVIVVWAVTGPLFSFSDTWSGHQYGTTIVTFLMSSYSAYPEQRCTRDSSKAERDRGRADGASTD